MRRTEQQGSSKSRKAASISTCAAKCCPSSRLKGALDISDPPPESDSEDDEDEQPAVQDDDTPPIDEELAFLLQPVKRENVVVVNYAGRRAGLVVDSLMGEYQTVIRPLGSSSTAWKASAASPILPAARSRSSSVSPASCIASPRRKAAKPRAVGVPAGSCST